MTRVLGLWAALPLLAWVGLVLDANPACAQVMEEEQVASPRLASPAPTPLAARAPGEEAEQRAAGAAPVALLSNFQTPWPAEAPQTAKGAVMAQAVEQLRARFADPAWTPQKTMVHGAVVTVPPKVARDCGPLHDFRMTTSGPPHHIKEYRGAAKFCGFHPQNAPAKVAGLILYADGSYWLGEVSGTTTSYLPMPSGPGEAGYPNGLRVLGVASPALNSDKGRGVDSFTFEASERAIFADGAMRAASLGDNGAGKGEMRWPDGRVFRGEFKNQRPSQGEMLFASGARVTGKFVGKASPSGIPGLSGNLQLTLAKAEGAFPAGTYRAYAPRTITDYRGLLTADAYPTRETLTRAPPRSPECPTPSVVPEGWVVWSGGCRGGDNPRIFVFAPDASSFIDEQPKAKPPLELVALRQNGEPLRRIQATALTSDTRPTPVGEATLLSADDKLVYRGAFIGQSPNGPGLCATPAAEGGGEEPCFYAQGARTDEIHLARREAAEAERQLKLAQAAAQQEANARAEAQRQADAERARAQEQANQAQRDYERRMAQAQEDEEDSGSGVNPIYQAMQELQGKFASAAVDMQNQRAQTDAMRANIEAQYRARQAEQARQQAQRNADVARQNAALNQQNADAARRAEIARQEAARAAQARADSLRAARERQQAAMAQAQLQQRQAASSIGGGSSASVVSGSSSSGAAARPGASPSILTFTNNYGWKAGDVSTTQNAQGVSISFTVSPSTQEGKLTFRARICNNGSTTWTGGVRMTDSYPDRAHVMAQAQPGGCYGLTEQFMATSRAIYVWVKNHGG